MLKTRATPARRLTALLMIGVAAAMVIGAADAPRNDFTFSLIGDRTGGHVPGVYERVWREIDLFAPDFALNVGDTIEGLVRGGDQEVDATNREWDEIQAMLAPYSDLPHYYTPGNHDIWNATSEEIYRARTGSEPTYSFRYQQALFVILDNSRTQELADAQYEFLEQALAENQDAAPKFVIFHRPFWIPMINLQNREHRLHQLCRRYAVSWVLSGHGHQLNYLPFDGVNYLEVGSSGGTIGVGPDGEPLLSFQTGRFFQHILVRVRGDRVQMTVRELDGARGEGRVFSISRWRGIRPAYDPIEDPAAEAAAVETGSPR